MAIAVSDVRSAVDRGRAFPPPDESPFNIGVGDGKTTAFAIPHRIDTTSLQVFFWANPVGSTNPGLPQLQDPSTWTYTPTPSQITLAAPLTQGVVVCARYSVVGFTDVEIQSVINRMTNAGFTNDDNMLLAACSHQIIGFMLADEERMKTVHQERFASNKSALVKELRQLRADLEVEMKGGILPGADIPQYSQGGVTLVNYQTPGI